MIVDTMSYQEIFAIIHQYMRSGSFANVLEREDRKHRSTILKMTAPKRVFFAPTFVKDPKSQLQICIHTYTDGKSHYKRNGLLFLIYAYFYRDYGLYAMLLVNNFTSYNVYTPHFFDRYRERFLKDVTLNKIDTIVRFFKVNNAFCLLDYDAPNYSGSKLIACPEGVCLGYMREEQVELKTFISFEMLKNNQIDLTQDAYDGLVEYYKEYYNLDITQD